MKGYLEKLEKESKTMTRPILKVKKLDPKAMIPQRGSEQAAGYDIYALEEKVVPAKGKALISTGIAMAIPEGNYGRIAPRSGLAAKNFIDVGAGVIDSDYRGEVKVLLFNFGDSDFKVSVHDRVAQLIIEKYTMTEICEIDDLSSTVRGEGGFGSTGVNQKLEQETKVGDKRPFEEIENKV
mmetsp:Transcript_13926/g.23687  ORF Transcript_13926/g.23687 Transcript_13926/m.23687 type:complete len:181 (-) Transcript_13926:125-667(-)